MHHNSFILAVLLFFASCASKPLVHPDLKRRAIIGVKLKPVIPSALETSNAFKVELNYTLNNGKTKTISKNHNQTSSTSWDPWSDFSFSVKGGLFKNGFIYINKKKMAMENHQVRVKVQPKSNLNIADSITVDIPYLNEIKISYDYSYAISPGFNLPLGIKTIFSNQKEDWILPNRKGELSSHDYFVEVNGEEINPPFIYNIPTSKTFHDALNIKCYNKSNPSLRDSMTIPMLYDGSYSFSFNGWDGADGNSGDDAYGKNGVNGRNGKQGQDGQNGGRGPWVKLILQSFKHNNAIILKAVAYSSDRASYCFVDPTKGRLEIKAYGGNGGKGGKGGRGTDGADETERCRGGYGGSGGDGGNGGNGGDGGTIKVYADSLAYSYIKYIKLDNKGGNGGNGGGSGRNGDDGSDSSKGGLMTILDILLPGRGNEGMPGMTGNTGPEPEVEVFSSQKIEEMIKRIDY